MVISRQWFNRVGILGLVGVLAAVAITASANLRAQEPPLQPGQLPKVQPGEPAPKQQPGNPSTAPYSPPEGVERLSVTKRTVLVPTTVVDRSTGDYINGLTTRDFTLYDNDTAQKIDADFSFEPLSVVVVVQANSDVEAMLPKLKTVGILLHGLVTGETGDVAVLAYDHRLRLIQDWTNDAGKLDDAMQKLTAGSSTAATIDAVLEADRMLRQHDPKNQRRRVIMLFSEGYDKGSQAKSDETLRQMQFDNVIVYAVDISKVFSSFFKRPDGDSRPLAGGIPAEAIHSPTGNVMTPTEVLQNNPGGNALNVVPPVWRTIKDLFKLPPDQAFTRMTGGRVYTFARQGALEAAVTDIGKELHSQYLLSYTPNNQTEPGFHKIRVEVDRPGLEVRPRPGYLWGGGVQ